MFLIELQMKESLDEYGYSGCIIVVCSLKVLTNQNQYWKIKDTLTIISQFAP